ncbi:hypothetical protein NPIL_58671 [Nephila pilipes]|uniref:Uncharacterized protein n=1 Tax=Nephila pilipes TaxID=299642 RepID=A0A8X6PPJ7_NEPPI|nr:hypothetical protein NPIL_58671 [Nephila pilipes]
MDGSIFERGGVRATSRVIRYAAAVEEARTGLDRTSAALDYRLLSKVGGVVLLNTVLITLKILQVPPPRKDDAPHSYPFPRLLLTHGQQPLFTSKEVEPFEKPSTTLGVLLHPKIDSSADLGRILRSRLRGLHLGRRPRTDLHGRTELFLGAQGPWVGLCALLIVWR